MRIGTGEITEELDPLPEPEPVVVARNGVAEYDRPRIYGSGLPFDGVDPADV